MNSNKDSFYNPILIRGITSSLGVSVILFALIVIDFTQLILFEPLISRILILIIFIIEKILLVFIYLTYKNLTSSSLIKDENRYNVFTKGYLLYLIFNIIVDIGSISLNIMLFAPIFFDPITLEILLYLIQILTLLAIIPLIIYILIWVLMGFMSKSDFNIDSKIKQILLSTAIFMIISSVTVFPISYIGNTIRLIAYVLQGFFLIKITELIGTYNKKAKSEKNIEKSNFKFKGNKRKIRKS